MLEGQRLLIKYPDNPNTVLLSSLVAKNQKPERATTSKKAPALQEPVYTTPIVKQKKKVLVEPINDYSQNKNQLVDANGMKLSGPVNGNECYFWRTTGCLYADKCRYDHIKKNKGVDKKPWHK